MDNITLAILILIFLIALSWVIVYVRFRKILAKRYSDINSISAQVYKSKQGNLEYFLRGNGPTILISHGITGGIDQGIGLSDDYIGSGYRFLYVSRFGYLKSSMPDNPSPELQADSYKELLDYLGIKSLFVFGNSAGGTSAIHFAIRYPQICRGLILLTSNAPMDNTPGHPPEFIFKSNFWYWFFMKLIGKSMMKMFVPLSILKDLTKQEKKYIMNGIFYNALPVTKRKEGIVFDMLISNPSINNEIPFEKITSPTLIINAIDDPSTLIEGAKNLEEKIKNSKLIAFETGGHLLLGQKQKTKKAIDNFAKDIADRFEKIKN